MARSIFPDEGSRLAYRLSGAGRPILSAAGGTAVVYTSEAATTLADIQTLEGVTVSGSTLTVTAYSQLPLFLGPDGVDTVWVKIDGGPAAPVYARTDDRLDELASGVVADLTGVVRSVNGVLPNGSGAVVIAPGGITDATSSVKGAIQLAGDLGGSASSPTTPTAVHKTGAETVSGLKTFNDGITVPDASLPISKTSGLQSALDSSSAAVTGAMVGLRYTYLWNGTGYFLWNGTATVGVAATSANSTAAARTAAGKAGTLRNYVRGVDGPDANTLGLIIDGDSLESVT